MRRFATVAVRMARAQRIAMSPAAITGMCGRLKCCLAHEYETYRELGKDVPRDGARVVCEQGAGVVVDRNILAGTVKVELEDRRVVEAAARDVRRARGPEPAGAEDEA
jgi:cell fate regulator YaaT (PSP1 superfamily)